MFLNSNGGTLFVGIEDRESMVRSYIDEKRGHMAWTEKELDTFTLLVDNKIKQMDPPVTEDLVQVCFVPIIIPTDFQETKTQ